MILKKFYYTNYKHETHNNTRVPVCRKYITEWRVVST